MANVLVTGAGNSAFNGVYEENGTFGGKAAYLHTGGTLHLFWDIIWLDWSLHIVQGPNGFYRSTGGPNLPANAWLTQPLGTAPAPTAAVMRYVSVENGNDANDGSTEALAWATVDHAASTAVAGEDVVIAPGTYRETITADNAGTAADRIRFIGDPECLYFDNEVPGRVRITDTNASEEPGRAGRTIYSDKNWVEWYKFWIDGSRRAIYFNSGWDGDRIIYDSVLTGYEEAQLEGAAVRCIGIGGQECFYFVRATHCIGSSSRNVFELCITDSCLALGGGGSGFYGVNNAACTARNCIAQNCNYGFRDFNGAGKIDSCLAVLCSEAANNIAVGEAVNCYYYNCRVVGDADFGSPGLTTLLDFSVLFNLLPWLAVDAAGGAIRQGDNTGPGFGADDTDIGAHRLRLKGADLDIGPWAISDPTDHPYGAADIGLLDWGIFQTTAPSIKIVAEGDYTIDVPAEAGTAITITVQSKHVSAVGNLPQLVLEGSSIVTQTDTNTAADDTWELLSVTATPTVDGVLTVILRARNTAGDCYFSDIGVS